VVTWESHLSLALSVLAVAGTVWLLRWSLPAQLVNWANSIDFRVRDAEKRVEKFNAEYLERRAAWDGFEDRCEEILASATSKQRRAAASLSRMEGKTPGGGEPQTHTEAPPPGGDEASTLAWARKRAGLN
jgi:hypothetical protein